MTENKNHPYSLECLEFTEQAQARILKAVNNTHGAVILAGPTGSGKTATSLALLGEMSPQVDKILAIDVYPREEEFFRMIPNVKVLPRELGLHVSDYNARTSREKIEPDYSYDVIYFNEIKDVEILKRVYSARVTGSGYPIATMHASSTVQAFSRLGDMGAGKVGRIGLSVTTIICQALVKKLCSCREAYLADPELTPKFTGLTLYRAKGCAKCYYKGTKGRRPIAEVMDITMRMNDVLVNNFYNPQELHTTEAQIRELAHEQGMRTLADEAWDLVCEGKIPVEEYYRFDPSPEQLVA